MSEENIPKKTNRTLIHHQVYLIQGLPLWTGDTGRSSCSCHFQLHPCRVHPEDGLERWNERNSRQAPNTASTILAPNFFLKSVKPKKKNQLPPLCWQERFDSSSNLRKLDPIHPFPPGMDFMSTPFATKATCPKPKDNALVPKREISTSRKMP